MIMITIEDMKIPPVGPEEFKEAYGTIRRHCRERLETTTCKGCYMVNICYSDCMPPKNWPDLEVDT